MLSLVGLSFIPSSRVSINYRVNIRRIKITTGKFTIINQEIKCRHRHIMKGWPENKMAALINVLADIIAEEQINYFKVAYIPETVESLNCSPSLKVRPA